MLSEDRVNTSVPSAYARINSVNYSAINNQENVCRGEFREDPFDAENDRHRGFSRDNPQVIQTRTNVVVLPSINKWNCFSIRDRRSIDVIKSRDNMNTATSVSPSSEVNSLFNERVADYPDQASRPTGNGLTRNNSGYSRTTLAKQRSEKENDSKSHDISAESRRLTKTPSVGGASTIATNNNYKTTVKGQNNDSGKEDSSEQLPRLPKATSVENTSTPPEKSHRPVTRSQSVAAITEEKTVFGFKVMKGLQGSSDNRNNNSSGFSRQSSYRQPSRTTSYSTANRFTDKAGGSTLFYTPKNNRVSTAAGKFEKSVSEMRGTLKRSEDSIAETKPEDVIENRNVQRQSSTEEKGNKDSCNLVCTTDVNDGGEEMRNVDKPDNSCAKADNKSNVDNGDVFRVSKEIEVKNAEGKTQKLLVRAESLREGISRLEKFREKQKSGKLRRSLTNPDFQENEDTGKVGKGKNISESLAEIRERIRERRRKKEKLKKSLSMPETNSAPKREDVEVDADLSHNHKEDIRKSVGVKNSEEMSNGKENIKELPKDIKNNVGAEREGGQNNNGESKKEKDSNLNKTEYLEIEGNSKINVLEGNVTVLDSGSEDLTVQTEGEKDVIRTDEVEVKNTSDNDFVGVDRAKEIGKDNDDVKEDDRANSEGKKVELKEILSNKKAESTGETKSEVETSVANVKTSNSEKDKSEVKKPTKRERRKPERYQRSKTMSAIMYDEISLDARREQHHKEEKKSVGNKGEPVAILSVSEIKKRFAEADNGSSKKPELGLFYCGKNPASDESLRTGRSFLPSNSGEKKTLQDDSATRKAKGRTKAYASRRHTLATGVTFHNETTEDVKNMNTEAVKVDVQSSGADKTKTTQDKDEIPVGRRHTLPSYTTEIAVKSVNGPSSSTDQKNDVSEDGGRLASRLSSRHNPVKVAESFGTVKEKFSKGEAPVFHLATADKTSSDAGGKKQSRRGNAGDSTAAVRKIIEEAKMLKNVNNNARSGSSLTRRHTIANRPAGQNSEKNELDKQEFLDKFLAKDNDIRTLQNVDKRTSTKDRESKTGDGEQTSRQEKKGKEEKFSGLKKLFHGKHSNPEKKTKLRERRAKTIAGGISPDIVKGLKTNQSNDALLDEYVAEPDVNDTDNTNDDAIKDRPGRRRRSSDLNPDNYLSPEPLTPEEEAKISVFADENPLQGDAQPDIVLSTVKTAAESSSAEFPSGRRCSVSDSDVKMASDATRGEDLVDLKAPTQTKLSRSGSMSEKDKVSDISGKDQCLDEYLNTAIKSQRASPRNSPQKSKFTSIQSLDHDERTPKTNQRLDVLKSNLSMHSWSTSDLDKIIHGGGGVSSSTSQVDISTMDLDEISNSTTRLQSLTEGRTKVRPKRTSSKSLNPMKSLMERTDIRTSTEEPEEEEKTASGFEKPKKRSKPRQKRSQLEPCRRHTLDPVALAALASREDFSRVSLRRTKGPSKEKDEYGGSLPIMLIQIKGRRQVQTRLVEPRLSSLNNGDCFILVTPKELFCWIGQHANTIEKAKAVEIASKIQKRGDMNCKTGDVLYIDEIKQGNTLAYRKFCKILEGDTDFPIEDAQLCPDDELYEREVISTNKVYKLQEGDPPHLIQVTELCGYMPRIGILNTKEVFVFDFGSELYLWTGQQSLSNKRKVAFHLAEMLYKQQFDFEALVNPIDPRRPRKRLQSPQPLYRDAEGNECGRPKWTLFGKLHEKAETLLFQEKFFDWPDPTKIIKMKGHVSSGELPVRPPAVELKPCDPTEMQKPASDLEPVILEATNLGRGLGTPNVEVNGEVKEGDLVTTLGTKVWLVTQNKHFDLPKTSEGNFHSGDGYVIRWVYFVAKNRIVRDKRGRVRPLTGRQRCAYFFWQGNECSVNEKGAAAIMAVELDEEHGPQIRVVEGKEPPHFLKLFDGGMVIHSGKRIRGDDDNDEFSDKSTVRMYCVRNEDISEGCLVQVKTSASSLRSRSSFVVVDSERGNVFVWYGCKTNEYHRKSAEKAANLIKEKRSVEMNLSEEVSLAITEFEEGEESKLFWSTVGGKKTSYLSLRREPASSEFSPRLFHMTSATGTFTATEILNPSRYSGRTCPFPVLQDDLYSACQPTAFVLDVGDELYVWEGWMPVEITKDKRGSAKRRWDEERKLTLQTTVSYVEEAKSRINKGAFVVQAGLEPLCFTTHFPFWNRRQDITDIQRKEGKTGCEKKPVKEALDTFTKKFYSLEQLTSDSPPDGVDPSKLETYLEDEEFERIFEMSPDLFNQLPGWKQDILKKAFGLF